MYVLVLQMLGMPTFRNSQIWVNTAGKMLRFACQLCLPHPTALLPGTDLLAVKHHAHGHSILMWTLSRTCCSILGWHSSPCPTLLLARLLRGAASW